MHLHDFHALDDADATAVVRVWADVPGWVAAVVEGRPYASVDALAAYAADLAATWSPADLEAALHAHPRIGANVSGDGAEAAASRREQGSMAAAADDDVAAIAAGNAAYEQRFGRVFLIRAAGRTPGELRAELERRLGSDPDSETIEATRQLAEIALLRLRTTFADDAPTEPEAAE
ncbi:2-oxo-4-hydroxy-4-carboxy-5-ureidoimidazoline decarboxylase [Microbacterium sp. CFBP 8790]|uniref:2-oxo-4-hydroxy-4-carboxy-5-ureidoimidazoline decarboxylase n=1 Tax=unclassified Microbacterium TaxID=2609290 RepID=UPI0017861DC4|nr:MULTISPECIES: 2-oxo-4-hydroxy-4-carboxy-5-ureidoimidazoline decarboxylase [unclassified Microbacterium]MBD8207015.1 2-oxo-4-hydroxy-4-carboxy-5-ureidoimidazoline decarboxylase [Microbacterium sp. CFBP 8801]MBD8508873.1 2-oxo-4-hydroxy-4-carboxy-5-ureidoimidazoline decarboxylase [Microbacterium sp. CFBP 8790]